MAAVQMYCTKCRAKREVENPEPFVTSNGRDAQRGTCPFCQTKVVRMGSPKS